MKRIFIGVDFSKLKFDVAVFEGATKEYLGFSVFENNLEGCQQALAWVATVTDVSPDGWLVCGEHTGLYSVTLTHYLCASGVAVSLEPGLQIKLSKGMTRGKNDKIDAGYIAEYAYRFQDKVKPYRVASAALSGLKDLVAYRNRLLGFKKSLTTSQQELQRVKADQTAVAFIYDDSKAAVNDLNARIKRVEAAMRDILQSDAELLENYALLTSIKGVGMLNAVVFLVVTGNFTLFSSARKLGSYCGVVPFEHRSGSSIRGRDKVSKLANKKMKVLLTLAARTAVLHDPVLRAYYLRKLAEGKHDRVIINNVRNKLVHRMFAVVRDKKRYDPTITHPLQQAA